MSDTEALRGPVALFLADGFEEIEALTVVDVLRRAHVDVRTVSVMDGRAAVTGAHRIPVIADTTLDQIDFDEIGMIVLPGGMPGTTNLEACKPLVDAIRSFDEAELPLCAICAAPMIFGHLGILEGRLATIYPGMEDELKGADVTDADVACDGHIITSRGPATALPFALTIAETICGADVAQQVADGMVCLDLEIVEELPDEGEEA